MCCIEYFLVDIIEFLLIFCVEHSLLIVVSGRTPMLKLLAVQAQLTFRYSILPLKYLNHSTFENLKYNLIPTVSTLIYTLLLSFAWEGCEVAAWGLHLRLNWADLLIALNVSSS